MNLTEWSADGFCKRGHDVKNPDNIHIRKAPDGTERRACRVCNRLRAMASRYSITIEELEAKGRPCRVCGNSIPYQVDKRGVRSYCSEDCRKQGRLASKRRYDKEHTSDRRAAYHAKKQNGTLEQRPRPTEKRYCPVEPQPCRLCGKPSLPGRHLYCSEQCYRIARANSQRAYEKRKLKGQTGPKPLDEVTLARLRKMVNYDPNRNYSAEERANEIIILCFMCDNPVANSKVRYCSEYCRTQARLRSRRKYDKGRGSRRGDSAERQVG